MRSREMVCPIHVILSSMVEGEKSQFHQSPCVSAERLIHQGLTAESSELSPDFTDPLRAPSANEGRLCAKQRPANSPSGRVLRLARLAPLIPSTLLHS